MHLYICFDDHLLRFLCTFNINGMRSILPVYLLSNEFPVIISVLHHPIMTFWGAVGAPILFSEIGFCVASCSYIYIYIYICIYLSRWRRRGVR